MKGLKIRVLVSLLLLALLQSAAATTIEVIYLDDPGEGARDETPVAPWFNNPGTTLGERRRIAHEYATRLLERAVWIDNSVPLVSNVYFRTLREGVAALDKTPVLVGEYYEGFADGYAITPPQLAVLNPDAAQRDLEAGDELKMRVQYNADLEFDYFLGEIPVITVNSFVITALHEFIHGLGFGSNVSYRPNASYTPTLFDRHVRLAGASPTRPEDMTPEQRAMLHRARENIRWVGPATGEAAGRIVPAGQAQGEVFLDGGGVYNISHLSQDEPSQIMSRGVHSNAPLRLGIAAYMLSDMGWGPVIDSRVTASSFGQNKVQVEVSTDAEAEQLLVNLQLPEGISVADTIASPATCETIGQTTGCRYTRLSGKGIIQYTLTGEPGIHEVKADVDHQALHVDENPVNNFATARVQVGENTIQGVTFDPGEIARKIAGTLPAGTPVGRLQVTGPAGIDHSFALARGGEHNACFRIEGDQVLTRTELDYEALSELDIRVETTASNGFRREDDLEVRATDVASSQQQPDVTCPPVELTVLDKGVVGPTWDRGFGVWHGSSTSPAACENDGGAGCPGISWLIVDDDSRDAVLEITNAAEAIDFRPGWFHIKARGPVDVSRFEGGTLEFDVRIISGDPEFSIGINCVYFCRGQRDQNPGAVVGSDWVTLSVNVGLVGPDALHTVETGFRIYVSNDVSATYQLDRVRWVAALDYDRSIQGVTLDPGEVAEAQPAGSSVGRLQVTGPEGRHRFALARGGEHNACFYIEGDRVLTRTELDYEALSELDIRVETTAGNGFRREDDLKIRVTDVASSQPQPDFTCPPVELTVFDEGVAGPATLDVGPSITWAPFRFGAGYFDKTGLGVNCPFDHDDGGAECPISWSMVDDISRGAVLEITDTVGDDPDLSNGRFYIDTRRNLVDVSRFEGGTLEFDVRIISGDPEFLIGIGCVHGGCRGFRNQYPGAVVGGDWVTLSVNMNDLIGPYAPDTVETGFNIYVTNDANATYRLDRVRWVADPDYDRTGGPGGQGSGE